MALLIDFNQALISNLAVLQSSPTTRTEFSTDVLRAVALTTLKNSRMRFRDDFIDHPTILCCDDKDYWRKEIFPYYKANRKKIREDQSIIPWEAFFESLAIVRTELAHVFNMPVILAENCEGDDVIAVVSRELVKEGHKVVIHSVDGDFDQLCDGNYIRRWNPRSQKGRMKPIGWVDSSKNPIMEKIIKGDAGDGIPNILSDDDAFVNPEKRQRPLRADRLKYFLSTNPATWDEEHQRNYARNRKMIDLWSAIPTHIVERIITAYEDATTLAEGEKETTVVDYLRERGLIQFLGDAQIFL